MSDVIDFAGPSREERVEQSREPDERADRRARERFSAEKSDESSNFVASVCGVTFKVQGAREAESETSESASERNTLHYARSRSTRERYDTTRMSVRRSARAGRRENHVASTRKMLTQHRTYGVLPPLVG